MSNVDRITSFAELNRHTALSFSEILKSADFEEIDQGICSIDEYKKAFNECVDNIKEYANRPKSTFIVKLFEYFGGQRYFYAINGVAELFSRRDYDTAEYLIYFNEINSTISNAIWRYDQELFDDLSLHCVETKTTEVIIKSEKLKYYFTSDFKGIGTGNENHFDNSLIPVLNQKRSAKELAGIALAIYNNDKVISRNKRPTTFSSWYEIFCDCLGTTKKTYLPKDLTSTQEKMTNALPFLS
jgi:transcription termination factor NusB